MNTLSDTLNDLIMDTVRKVQFLGSCPIPTPHITNENSDKLIMEYVERIKNELNVEKYLK